MGAKAVVWGMGSPTEVPADSDSVCVDAVLADGRTVQVVLRTDGHVLVRGWGATPIVTGNVEAASVSFTLPTVEQMIAGDAVTIDQVRTHQIGLDHVIAPGRETWYHADEPAKRAATRIRDAHSPAPAISQEQA